MTQFDTIIVGAGLAGLAAARALESKGQTVLLVEARERPGGRIHSADGFDFGAHWIHGTEGNPLTNLARGLGVPIHFVGGDSTYTGGWSRLLFPGRPEEEKDRSIMIADAVLDAIDEARSIDARDRSMDAAFSEAVAQLGLNDEEIELARWHLNLLVREDCATDLAALSSRHWDEGFEVYGYGDSIFRGGFQSLTDQLARALNIQFNCVVTRIVRHADGALVETADGSFRGKRVIVTVPLGVLKAGSIAFEPPLPEAKRDVIARLGVGTLAKIGLRFDRIFWPQSSYVFGFPQGDGECGTVAINKASLDGSAELILLIGGALGTDLEAMSDGEACDWAMARLRALFGADVPDPIAIQRTAWSRDPFACGAYSNVAVGATPADFGLLGEPVGDWLFFAGEATSRTQWATAHGAWVSGLREAARITGDLTLLPPNDFTENRRWRTQMARASRFLNLRVRSMDVAEIDRRTALLSKCMPFAEIDPAELRLLATMFEQRQFAPGDWLCREGERANHVFLIEAGEVEVLHEGQPRLALLAEGTLLGEYGLFHDATRTASMRAVTAVGLLSLDYQRFQRFLLAYPQASLALLRTVIARTVQ